MQPPGAGVVRLSAVGPLQTFANVCFEGRSRSSTGVGSGRRGALLRSCPPTPACGRRLLLDFAAPHAAPTRSCAAVGFRGLRDPQPVESVGWVTQRNRGRGTGEARHGGHERSRPPDDPGPRGPSRRCKQALGAIAIRAARPCFPEAGTWTAPGAGSRTTAKVRPQTPASRRPRGRVSCQAPRKVRHQLGPSRLRRPGKD